MMESAHVARDRSACFKDRRDILGTPRRIRIVDGIAHTGTAKVQFNSLSQVRTK